MQLQIRTALFSTAAAASAPLALAQLPTHYTVPSPDNSPAFAIAASAMGDIDGDGVNDFAVGESTATPFTPPDQVHLFSGATGALLTTYTEFAAGEKFGESLVGVGDIDGDLIGDLLVGSPDHDGAGTSYGRADLFSGADGSVIRSFFGTDNFHGMGSAVGAPGDVNGDGVPDLLITAGGESQSPAWGGIARLYSGADGSELLRFDNGTTTSDIAEGFGDHVTGGGDLDGDGVPDLLISAQHRLFSGIGRRGAVEGRSGVDGSILFQLDDIVGEGINQAFGRSVDAQVDLNGDGVGEILVGAPGDSEGGPYVGAVYVYDGATRALIVKHLGADDGNGSLGRHVEYVGDVNGDGTDDYAGIYAYGGTIGFAGYVKIWSGADHTLLDELHSGGTSDGFGSAFAALGDVNGDLLPDFVVGARQARQVYVMTVAGSREYGEVAGEATQTLDLAWVPAAGADPARGTLEVAGAEPFAYGLFMVSQADFFGPFLSATLLIDLAGPGLALVPIYFDGAGKYASPETTLRQPALDGVNLFCQILALDSASPLGFVTSAGLDLRLTN
ncbi:integrin alpha [Engelhardtia mirabilis]|uniref:FG-GAP repeat protein n=1 Tax=Engelhardtia mirabilis TaxID=2528011 RepID=A0A518BDG0_9BACT|nr:FG-GAP repeat protein [Planctomycetes bacterium Pla133]QDU99356.1 FG-GAP repeat protein [Planctomycetes bacterium Pla86]